MIDRGWGHTPRRDVDDPDSIPVAYSAGEVFPNGRQVIPAKYIIAAIRTNNINPSSSERLNVQEVTLNESSIFYADLKKRGLTDTHEIINACSELPLSPRPLHIGM